MTWIILVLIVGECLILIKLLLWYQNRVQTLDTAQYPLKQRVEKHHDKLQEIADDIRNSADSFLEQLEQAVSSYTMRTEYTENILAELDPAAFKAHQLKKNASDEKEEEPIEQDEVEQDDVIVLRKSDAYKVDVTSENLNPEQLAQKILRELDETYEYIEALGRDAPIITEITSQVSEFDRVLTKT